MGWQDSLGFKSTDVHAEDLGSISAIHMVAHSILNSIPGEETLASDPQGHQLSELENTVAHEIKYLKCITY